MNIKEFAKKYLNIDTRMIQDFPVFRKYDGEIIQCDSTLHRDLLRQNTEYVELQQSDALYTIQSIYYFWGRLDSE